MMKFWGIYLRISVSANKNRDKGRGTRDEVNSDSEGRFFKLRKICSWI
jgi:hypothetical protein